MTPLNTQMAEAVMWIESKQEDAHYTFQNQNASDGDDDEEEATTVRILGPPSQAFPIANGWSPQDPHPDPQYAITSLTHLTIKRLTKLFTHHTITTARPNCEEAWNQRIRGPPIPWDDIWPTLNTPLSDATEERNWRKMLHRAIHVRNRDPKLPSKACRLRCGDPDESMLHLVFYSAKCTPVGSACCPGTPRQPAAHRPPALAPFEHVLTNASDRRLRSSAAVQALRITTHFNNNFNLMKYKIGLHFFSTTCSW